MGEGVKSRAKASTSGAKGQLKSSDTSETQKQQFSIMPMIILLCFSTAMLVLPLGTYFIIYWYIIKSTTIAAMGAVVVVQIIVAVYIYKAWHDEKNEHEAQLKQKKQS